MTINDAVIKNKCVGLNYLQMQCNDHFIHLNLLYYSALHFLSNQCYLVKGIQTFLCIFIT